MELPHDWFQLLFLDYHSSWQDFSYDHTLITFIGQEEDFSYDHTLITFIRQESYQSVMETMQCKICQLHTMTVQDISNVKFCHRYYCFLDTQFPWFYMYVILKVKC